MMFRKKAVTQKGNHTTIMFAEANNKPRVDVRGVFGFGIEWEICQKSEQVKSGAINLGVCTDSTGQSVRYFGSL